MGVYERVAGGVTGNGRDAVTTLLERQNQERTAGIVADYVIYEGFAEECILDYAKRQEADKDGGLKSLTVMIGARNTFLVSFTIIDLVFAMLAWLSYSWGFMYLES